LTYIWLQARNPT